MQRIVQTWLDRQFHMPLTMTPCDLWKYLDNRTFYLLGDSMMLDFYKASIRVGRQLSATWVAGSAAWAVRQMVPWADLVPGGWSE